ncbi:LysR family transcriptional regulator [Amycolatopsis suaedae]|uniref:LysR family transcriptional regulator n=1 Tax=Amycolatopsis suaedae TaxID=2510978 RepID=A0A4Q7J6V1_9PSEU|nr:LysR family transcriptional regulator [Amycolatopsis suaedae]RZQ62867.1 LysR family transcriptional regulator [Amycolatopsis suaedae]
MELRALRAFVTVAEELHFGRAAERLHIVQPAVSQQVARLERELGVRLLDRTRRSVRLTDAGTRVLDAAREALVAADRVRAVAVEPVPGDLRIGTGPEFAARIERGIELLREYVPQLRATLVELPVAPRLEAVRRHEVGFALVRGVVDAPGLRVHPIWSEPLVAVLSVQHPAAGKPSVRVADLAPLPLRYPNRSCEPSLHATMMSTFAGLGLTPTLGRPTGTIGSTLVEVGADRWSWTLLPAGEVARAGLSSVVGVPLDPEVTVPGSLVYRDDMSEACVSALTRAFAGAPA